MLPTDPYHRIALGYAPCGMPESVMYELWRTGNPLYESLRAKDQHLLDAVARGSTPDEDKAVTEDGEDDQTAGA